MVKKAAKVVRRDDSYAKKISTKIWHEQPSEQNPYIAQQSRCHGYDLIELVKGRSYVEVLYLLFRGELPTEQEAAIFEQLLISFINPGPRHPATRSAIVAGVGKTDPVHILPIALSTLSGNFQGAGEVEPAVRFLRKNAKKPPEQVALALLDEGTKPAEGDWSIAPGFGSYYGGVDLMAEQLAQQLGTLPGCGKLLFWGDEFSHALHDQQMGWQKTGVAAAVLADLGFLPFACASLYQLISAPGLLAHGLEYCKKPMTSYPFPEDKDYVIEE